MTNIGSDYYNDDSKEDECNCNISLIHSNISNFILLFIAIWCAINTFAIAGLFSINTKLKKEIEQIKIEQIRHKPELSEKNTSSDVL